MSLLPHQSAAEYARQWDRRFTHATLRNAAAFVATVVVVCAVVGPSVVLGALVGVSS